MKIIGCTRWCQVPQIYVYLKVLVTLLEGKVTTAGEGYYWRGRFCAKDTLIQAPVAQATQELPLKS